MTMPISIISEELEALVVDANALAKSHTDDIVWT